MTAPQLAPALRHVRQLMARADATGLTDAQLLRRFVAQRDEAAFEVLVWRHGPMALGVCRRILRNPHDADDAFQAALLALARKAPSIARGGSVGGWLFQVARRTALRARAQALRRARRETQAAELAAAPDPRAADPDRHELGPVLDEELHRLPEKYRAPVVLCYLEGLTNEEAACHLRCPVGTVKTRLARARELLASRLARRGLAPGAGLLAGGIFAPAAALPARLVSPAVRAAALVVSGQGTAAGVVPARVALLAEGVLRAMTIAKLRLWTAALAAALVIAGTGVVSYRALRAEPAPAGPADAAARVEQIKSQIADLQEQLRQAEQEAAAGRRPPTVAVIFGDVPITREELADHLLARLSREQLDAFINRRIIEHACQRRGIRVTDAEVDAALREDRKAIERPGQDFPTLLRTFQKTPLEWKEDVVRPRLLMTKLCQDRVRVTEKDLHNAFEARHGEKVECQLILWPRGQEREAAGGYEALRSDQSRFELMAGTQPNESLARIDGRVTLGRHATGNEELEKLVFRLRPGEMSRLVDTPEGLVVVKCLRRIPADGTQDFEVVREALKREVLRGLVEKEIPRAFQELKAEARPRLLWTPKGP